MLHALSLGIHVATLGESMGGSTGTFPQPAWTCTRCTARPNLVSRARCRSWSLGSSNSSSTSATCRCPCASDSPPRACLPRERPSLLTSCCHRPTARFTKGAGYLRLPVCSRSRCTCEFTSLHWKEDRSPNPSNWRRHPRATAGCPEGVNRLKPSRNPSSVVPRPSPKHPHLGRSRTTPWTRAT